MVRPARPDICIIKELEIRHWAEVRYISWEEPIMADRKEREGRQRDPNFEHEREGEREREQERHRGQDQHQGERQDPTRQGQRQK